MQIIFLLLWLCAAAFYMLSAWAVRDFFRRSGRAQATAYFSPPVSVLKPLMGSDPHLYENLLSFIRQDYPAFQTIFGVMDEDDPAKDTVLRLMREFPDADIDLAVSGDCQGSNKKVCNLLGMQEKASHDIIIIADGDMRVGPDYLRQVAADFADPETGVVTCLYRGAYPENMGAGFEALTINTDFLPSVLIAIKMEGLNFALGATMAVRREALESIGGFGALADYLADDYQLGYKAAKAGYKVRLSRCVIDSVQGRDSFPGYFMHQLRWGRTYRVCRPAGYGLSVLTKGTAFSLFFLISSGFSPAGWLLFAANLLLRYAEAFYIESRLRASGALRYFILLPVKDLVSFFIWALSFVGNRVKWKDRIYRVTREGKMEAIT